MCMDCGPLIKAIDAYIEKADSDLADALAEEDMQKPKRPSNTLRSLRRR